MRSRNDKPPDGPPPVEDVCRAILTEAVPEAERRRRYNGRRHRFGYPAYAWATISQVDEVLRCTGCPITWRHETRLVTIRPGCPVHSAPKPTPARFRDDYDSLAPYDGPYQTVGGHRYLPEDVPTKEEL